MTTNAPSGFLWGASTAPHQVEGNNLASDWWAREAAMPGMERSGDACDSYHRYREDMTLLAESGLNAYRFGFEWARIQPERGLWSNAELDHYRRMVGTALELGITPVVTLSHFTMPRWFAEAGGFRTPDALELFGEYVERVAPALDGVDWVVTINEPNMLALMLTMSALAEDPEARKKWESPTVEGEGRRALPDPDPAIGAGLVAAHQVARERLRSLTSAKIGWSVASGALVARPGSEELLRSIRHVREDMYLEAARGDDFIGVQAYSSQWVGPDGIEPHPAAPDNTLVGTAFRPDSLGMAVRHAAEVTGTAVLVTENGIATGDDAQRIEYTRQALGHLTSAMADGVDVRGYLHWSLLDNYEWGHWDPTFGLVAVDRQTFVRTPKPSLAWLGAVARGEQAL